MKINHPYHLIHGGEETIGILVERYPHYLKFEIEGERIEISARLVLRELTETERFKWALEKIAKYDEESIWQDSRKDSAEDMPRLAQWALNPYDNY